LFATTARLRPHRRVLISALLSALLASVALVGTTGPAQANGSWAADVWSKCQKAWNSDPYGSVALLHENYTATTNNSKHVMINNAWAIVDHFNSCSPQGGNVRAYKVVLDVTFRFRGSGMSCSVSYPLGWTCTHNTTDIVFRYSTTCQYNVLVCQLRFGELHFYAAAGMSYQNIAWMQTAVRLIRSDGSSYTFNTPAI
jgi:hypothetical protein